MELAVAAFAARLLQDVVASAAAQALAVVHARAGFVADAALRARRVGAQVPLAEVGRLFEVDQLVVVGAASVVVVVAVLVHGVGVGVLHLARVPVVGLDESGDVEAVLE